MCIFSLSLTQFSLLTYINIAYKHFASFISFIELQLVYSVVFLLYRKVTHFY